MYFKHICFVVINLFKKKLLEVMIDFCFVEINEIVAYLGTTHVQAAAYHTKFFEFGEAQISK